MPKRSPGLYKKGEVWQIDKRIRGYGRFRESTGERSLALAERYLAKKLEEIREVVIYGEVPRMTFLQAATKYINEEKKKSLIRDVTDIQALMPFFGDMYLDEISNDAIQPFIKHRLKTVKTSTVNRAIRILGLILKKASGLWRTEQGVPYLSHPPILLSLKEVDKSKPMPITWGEQEILFRAVSEVTRNLLIVLVNTGARNREICQLTWDYEMVLPGTGIIVFCIPAHLSKSGRERFIFFNDTAKAIIDLQRDKHPRYVFPGNVKDKPIYSAYTSSFRRARHSTGIKCRVHDLRHTFATRLRNAGVSKEDRRELLGHASGSVTTDYSSGDIQHLYECVSLIAKKDKSRKSPELLLVRNTNFKKKAL